MYGLLGLHLPRGVVSKNATGELTTARKAFLNIFNPADKPIILDTGSGLCRDEHPRDMGLPHGQTKGESEQAA